MQTLLPFMGRPIRSGCRAIACQTQSRFAHANTDAAAPTTSVKAEPARLKKPKPKAKRQSILQKPAPTSLGEVVAFATADSYDLEALQKVLQERGLIQSGPSDAINLRGEAIYLPRWHGGEASIFENGTFVTWGVGKDGISQLLSQVIQSDGVQQRPYLKPQEETLPFTSEEGPSRISGDLVVLGTTSEDHVSSAIESGLTPLPPPGQTTPLGPATLPPIHATGLLMTPSAILDRFAFSSGLVRSCKLAVYEELLDEHLEEVEVIPRDLQINSKMKLSRQEIVARFGYLLDIRQALNLTESNLLDPPELLWETGEAAEKLYESTCAALDLQERLDILNKKIDYAENLQKTLMEMQGTQVSHRLEVVIILLIALEIVLPFVR